MIFFFDLTRPSFNKDLIHLKYARHIKQLFEWQIQKVSNKELRLIDFDKKLGFSREKFYSLMNIGFKEENWVQIYDATPTKEAVEYIKEFIDKDKLVISYEISPILVKIFDIIKVNYIDIRVSPIKYLDDLVLGFKTNNSDIFNKLLKYNTNEDQYYFEASLTKSKNIVSENNLNLEPNSALFLEQTKCDASLIKNDKVLNILDFKDKFIEKTKDFKVIYYKKHPYQKTNMVDHKFITNFKNIKIIDDNIYKILSNQSIVECFSISSGVLEEAKYFDKKIDYFFNPIYDLVKDNEFSDKKYISVYNQALEPNFWCDILSPIFKTVKCDNVNLAPVQSRVRYLHSLFWGYMDKNDESIEKLDQKLKKLNDRRLIKRINKFIRKFR